jgi:hypothetical protein
MATAGALALLAAAGAMVGAAAEPADVELGTAISLDTSRAPLDGEWVVVAATGEATWRPGADARWRPIEVGAVLPAPSEIETGPTGGVTLVLGGDRLVVAPDSRLILSARGHGEDQRLRQERGRLRVDIEPRSGRDVEVRTPLLSLGIKGTSFEVAVDPLQSSILVLDGRVTVSTADGRPPVELGPLQGLSQPSDLRQPARRLELPDLPSTFSRTGPVRWHLDPPAQAAGSGATGSGGSAPAPTVFGPARMGQAPPQALGGLTAGGSAGSARASTDLAPARTAAAPAQAVGNQAAGGAGSAPGSSAAHGPVPASEAPAQHAEDRGSLGAWVEDQHLPFTLVAVAAAALVFLIVPGVVLGQTLRQQWLERSGEKGKRRRDLIRGG